MTKLELLRSKLPAHPGVHSEDNNINTAVLVLLFFFKGEYHFVFQKRVPHIRQGGEICFPGGYRRPQDATFEQTAIRETVEEMGIPTEKLTVIGQLDTLITPLGVSVNAFVGVANIINLGEVTPNRDEVDRVFSVPVSYFKKHAPQKYETLLQVHPTIVDEKTGREIVLLPARELGLPDKYTKPWGGVKHAIYVYKVEQGTIWGLTARIIIDVVNKLKDWS